jgi:hypothetical protein
VRQVKGVLFADYVRMLRSLKGIDWSAHLQPDDLPYLKTKIEGDQWYPMETFERMGNAILRKIARGDLEAVRQWGRLQTDLLVKQYPSLVDPDDPVETLNRFRVLRSTFFDFDAIEIVVLVDGEADVIVRYHMGMPAEEAACYQTMGFFQREIELAGGTKVSAQFVERSWAGDPRTLMSLRWRVDG